MFLPKKDIDIVGEIGIRYEKHPWIEQFEFDGLNPRTPAREGFGPKRAKAFAESLSKIYAKAYDDYAAMCSEEYVNDENEDGLDVGAYFSNAADYFVQSLTKPENARMFRKFCGYVENMWRLGTETMHDVALKTVLPMIESDSKAQALFYDTITPEFREYIDENGYNAQNN